MSINKHTSAQGCINELRNDLIIEYFITQNKVEKFFLLLKSAYIIKKLK